MKTKLVTSIFLLVISFNGFSQAAGYLGKRNIYKINSGFSHKLYYDFFKHGRTQTIDRYLNYGISYERVAGRRTSYGIQLNSYNGIVESEYVDSTVCFQITGLDFLYKKYFHSFISPLGWYYQIGMGFYMANSHKMTSNAMIVLALGQDKIFWDKIVFNLGFNLRLSNFREILNPLNATEGPDIGNAHYRNNLRFTVGIGIGWLN